MLSFATLNFADKIILNSKSDFRNSLVVDVLSQYLKFKCKSADQLYNPAILLFLANFYFLFCRGVHALFMLSIFS